ncbi:MAG: hypothetical protein ACLS4Z_08435 [Christensenellaceae bacterium]
MDSWISAGAYRHYSLTSTMGALGAIIADKARRKRFPLLAD